MPEPELYGRLTTYLVGFGTGAITGVLACLAWRGGASAVAYWLRVFFGSLTAGIIAGGGALGIGGAPVIQDGALQLTITKGTLLVAGLVALLAMAKDMQTYLRVPPPRDNGPPRTGRSAAPQGGGT